jgi:hypothetical protein
MSGEWYVLWSISSFTVYQKLLGCSYQLGFYGHAARMEEIVYKVLVSKRKESGGTSTETRDIKATINKYSVWP